MSTEKKSKLCPQCLNRVPVLWEVGNSQTRGMSVCPDCYHKHYGKKKFTNHNKPEYKPTLEDLKRKLEKKGW